MYMLRALAFTLVCPYVHYIIVKIVLILLSLQDDLQARGKISHILNRIANYQAGIEPNIAKEQSDKDKQVIRHWI